MFGTLVLMLAKRAVQILQLSVGRLQHVRLAGDALCVARLQDVQGRAQRGDQQGERQHAQLHQPIRSPALGQHVSDGGGHRHDLQGVDDDGEADRLLRIEPFDSRFTHTD